MKFGDLLLLIGDRGVFRTPELLAGQQSVAHLRRQLNRWARSGKITMLRRGVYTLSSPYGVGQRHPFVLANALRKASYVSLESALSYFGMIPEHTPVTTSVTTNRTEELETSFGRFCFRHVKKAMFSEYARREVAPRQWAFLALPEKALVDLLYLTPDSDQLSYLKELRVEPSSVFDEGKFLAMAEQSGSGKVLQAARTLKQLWQSNGEDQAT